MSNDIGRLFQGLGYIQRTNTSVSSIGKKPPEAPRSRIAASSAVFGPRIERHIECDSQWEDKIKFDGPVSTLTSDLTTYKLHWNIVILTPCAKCLVVDVKKYCLNNLMAKHEYYKIVLSLIPQDVIVKYNLVDNQTNIFIYVRVEKRIYGPVQAGTIIHTELKEHLRSFIYEPVPINLEFWLHNNN